MSTADVIKALPHLKGYKRKGKATFENLELRSFIDPNDEDNLILTCEDTVSGKIEELNYDYFYDFCNNLSVQLSDSLKNQASINPSLVFDTYLSLVNSHLKSSFIKALVAEISGRSSWGSLATIVKDAKKLLTLKTIEFESGMELSSPSDGGEIRLFFFPKDMSEEFGDASFRIEISYQETNPQNSLQVEIITD